MLFAHSVHAAVAQKEEYVENELRDRRDLRTLGRCHCVNHEQTYCENLLQLHYCLLAFVSKGVGS